jgi:hypothetical protein
MLELAKKKSDTSAPLIGFQSPQSDLADPNSLTPAPSVSAHEIPMTSTMAQVSMEAFKPANFYRIIGGLFLFFLGCSLVLYFLFFREPSSSQKAAVLPTDNLFVTSDPPEATLSIDGKDFGPVGTDGLSLFVTPNTKHEIVLSKEGFRGFSLTFVAPSDGLRKVSGTLVRIKQKSDTSMVAEKEEKTEKNDEEETQTENARASAAPRRSPKKGRHIVRPWPHVTNSTEKHESEVKAEDAPEKRRISIVDDAELNEKGRISIVDDAELNIILPNKSEPRPKHVNITVIE